jgi:hypothetical protein
LPVWKPEPGSLLFNYQEQKDCLSGKQFGPTEKKGFNKTKRGQIVVKFQLNNTIRTNPN